MSRSPSISNLFVLQVPWCFRSPRRPLHLFPHTHSSHCVSLFNTSSCPVVFLIGSLSRLSMTLLLGTGALTFASLDVIPALHLQVCLFTQVKSLLKNSHFMALTVETKSPNIQQSPISNPRIRTENIS